MSKNSLVTLKTIEHAILTLRGRRVLLDSDLAALYGVETKALNQAVKRSQERFPEDFAYQLTQKEFTALMSQNVMSKGGRGGRRTRPWVFTEQGVAMLSSVLQSPTAARVNVDQPVLHSRCHLALAQFKPQRTRRATFRDRDN